MRSPRCFLTLSLAAGVFGRLAAQEAHHHHDPGALTTASTPAGAETPLYGNLGTYHMAITAASPVAQQYFDQGIRLTYGFNHDEAIKSFKEGIRIDSACAMCWWGIANALGPNINLPMDTSAMRPAYEASQQALRLAGKVTPRERAYIEAQVRRYGPTPVADRSSLDSAYTRAMGAVSTRFPADDDAATLFAESMMDLRPWHYWTNSGRPMAPSSVQQVEVLERVVMRNPNHPGACHFYIHAVEASNDAQRALPCATRLQTLVPGAGHLVHMPTHIYMRLGMWDLAVEHNEHAVAVDERFIRDRHPSGIYPMGYYPHNLDVMLSALSMLGRGSDAIATARKISGIVPYAAALQVPPLESFAIKPLYTLARFGRWDEILKEPAPPAGLRYANGVWHYTRGLALAAREQYDSASVEHDSVAAIASTISPDVPASLNPAKAILAIAERHLSGDIAARQGKRDEAMSDLKAGIALEDELTYDEPAGWYLPLRQPLGALLVVAGRPKDAEREYRQDLLRFPHNGWSLRGLESSLRAQKRTREADAVAAELKKVWSRADVTLATN
ncbi:MAG: tetratricopeptide repeat protein [Gemmatimonadales bacterium]